MDDHNYTPEYPKSLRAPSQEIHAKVPESWVSFDGAALLWIDAILLVPAIFGIMFLPEILRVAVYSLIFGMLLTYAILYAWARVHPTSAVSHLLQVLHLAPPTRVPR